jgi:hypothetical protein
VYYSNYYDGGRQVVNELEYGMTETNMLQNCGIIRFTEVPHQFLGSVFTPTNKEGMTKSCVHFGFCHTICLII